MFGRVVHVIGGIVDIVCLFDHDRVLLELLDTPTDTEPAH